MTPRVCADALWREFLAHLKTCAKCQERGEQVIAVEIMPDSCPEGWALLRTWNVAAIRERNEAAEMDLENCAEGL